MSFMSESEFKRSLGDALKEAEKGGRVIIERSDEDGGDLVLISRSELRELYLGRFSDPERFREVLTAYSNSEVTRGHAMQALGTSWYGDLLDVMAELQIPQPRVSEAVSDEMAEKAAAILFPLSNH